MDAYAKYRNALVASNQRHGLTLSINWPLWKEGGMRVTQRNEKLMPKIAGMVAMETRTGIQALYRALASGEDQMLVLAGDLAKIRACLLGTVLQSQSQPAKVVTPTVSPEQLREKTFHQLKILFGEVTKLGLSKIDTDEPFESYGIDSFMIIQLNPKLDGISSCQGTNYPRPCFTNIRL